MVIKKKSLVVALVSGFVIAYVLILTLIGYVVYIEIRNRDFVRSYQYLLQKISTRIYSKHIVIARLNAKIELTGPLKSKPVIEGTVNNTGFRDISNLLLKIDFLDQDGAVIYETLVSPQEPALGSAGSKKTIYIPYLYAGARTPLKAGDSLPFKIILADCPQEILSELQNDTEFGKGSGWWSGKLDYSVLLIEF